MLSTGVRDGAWKLEKQGEDGRQRSAIAPLALGPRIEDDAGNDGFYEQKLKADATMTWVIAASLLVMLLLIYLGTRSALTTAIIISCNVTVTTAGGFIAIWLSGVEMTTAVIVGFLALLGVMFNDGILLGTYLHEQFRLPPRTFDEMHQRIFTAGLR